MTLIQFTRNHTDHSTDKGYQFEFFCDRCGNGFKSEFQASAVGIAATALRAAGGFFGVSREDRQQVCRCPNCRAERSLADDLPIAAGDKILVDKIGSLRRFKDDASEVKSGLECGIGFDKYNDLKVGDVIEVFSMERVLTPA
jgi:hypothetical protein